MKSVLVLAAAAAWARKGQSAVRGKEGRNKEVRGYFL